MTVININGADSWFGGCPKCGSCDRYLNVAPFHWFVCDTHKNKWCIGENQNLDGLSWQDRDIWHANEEALEGYIEVEPMAPAPQSTPEEYNPFDDPTVYAGILAYSDKLAAGLTKTHEDAAGTQTTPDLIAWLADYLRRPDAAKHPKSIEAMCQAVANVLRDRRHKKVVMNVAED